jgi:serine/threonine protein kinase
MLKKTLGGRYSLISRLGAGGFGETYLAEDVQLPDNHCCVVKHLKPQSIEAEVLDISRRLFDSEAKVLHRLGSHSQIPRLLANFEENQEFYLVQEFIEGNGLDRELIAGNKWSAPQVVNLLQDILSTLEFVHQQKVIHRDIKPENLIRRKQDGKIVLIDFGAVKQIYTQLTTSKRAKSTITIGTMGYMPSEQANGYPQINSDIYALGIIAIQALTGLDPEFIPKNPNTLEIEWSHLVEIDLNLMKILDKMVRYDFRQRYGSATEVLKDLELVDLEFIDLELEKISPIAPEIISEISPEINTIPTETRSNSQNLPTEILVNDTANENASTFIELSSPQAHIQTEISSNSISELPETVTAAKSTAKSTSETKSETKLTNKESQVTSRSGIIIGAIAVITLISAGAINKIYQVNTPEPAPTAVNIPIQPQPDEAEVLLKQVEVLEQISTKIKNGSDLQEIETLAASIPEDSPLRNKANAELVTYKQQWNRDKLAFNEVSAAYKAKKWKIALNAYKKITTSYWQKETKWIVNKSNAEIKAAIAPRLPRLPRIVRQEVPIDTPETYTPPSPTYYEPPVSAPVPAYKPPVSSPTPSSEKFSIPEAQ